MPKRGRPRTQEQDRVVTAVRLPRRLHRRLAIEAARRGISTNHIVVAALEPYVTRLEEQKVLLP